LAATHLPLTQAATICSQSIGVGAGQVEQDVAATLSSEDFWLELMAEGVGIPHVHAQALFSATIVQSVLFLQVSVEYLSINWLRIVE
jgi:hypothetical protein